MKYSELINFNPIESIIQINEADDKAKAISLTKSYVMSDDMAEKLDRGIINELQLDEVVDNKGVLLVGNYGTGKSHLMSVISAVAADNDFLQYLENKNFAKNMECIAGKFEVLRIEIGSTTMSLRNIILNKVEQDFKKRGLSFSFPNDADIINNKEVLENMMEIFLSKYPEKGYLIVIDEFLDYLGGRKETEIKLDLGFMRELGEIVKRSRLRVIFGVQEKLFDNPSFSFVSMTLNRVKDRFEQVIIRKEDTSYVVSERILKKTPEQKSKIREHLQKFCSLYTNMSERLEEYVELFPIHPAYIDVFNKIYIIENRHILKNISEIIRKVLDNNVTDEAPGIISFDSYWTFIKENFGYRTDVNIKEVVEKSGLLEDIVNRSFPKKLYKPLAIQIIYALSVHRLTTGDISVRSGLTSENLRDDLCLYLNGMPELDSEFLQSVIQQVLKDTMATVSGQFIEYNVENGQYYLDLKKDIDYDEKITQKAAILDDSSLNRYFFDVAYYCLEWDQKEHVTNFKIYEHTLNWESHNIFRRGYLFMGTPEERPTAQPPEDYYMYILPPYGNEAFTDDKKEDEVFFTFKQNDDFKNDLKLYAAALSMKDLAEEKNKETYQNKASTYKKKLTRYLSENKNTCFEVTYKGVKKQLIEVLKGKYNKDFAFKETIDTAASICLDNYFSSKYTDMPIFKTKITLKNQADTIRAGIDHFAGRTSQQSKALLESFNLLEGDKISVGKSKYAAYYINQLSKLPPKGVINFSDIYNENFNEYLDKQFEISYALLPIILVALVHSGNAVIVLKSGTTLTASNLDILPKTNVVDIYEFKYISKPKDMALLELIRLFEILGIPKGLINNPGEREKGLEELIKKTTTLATKAVQASTKLNGEFELWGEPLIGEHILYDYKQSIKRVIDEFGNFGNRYNTVAKLNNFSMSMEQVEQIGKDIEAVEIVIEYDKFKNACISNVGYVMNLELMELGADFKSKIEIAKSKFRDMRDSIDDNKNGEGAAADVNHELTILRDVYIDIYFTEHQKKRLGVKEGQRKGELISSQKLTNLKRLKAIDILSTAKLTDIENLLANLKVCYELTPVMLKSSHICPKCGLKVGDAGISVSGQLDAIEDKIDNLISEWTKTLLNTLSDPLVLAQENYLKPEQKKVIDAFLKSKALPNTVDNFFITSINDLLKGFDPIVIQTEEFMHKIDEILENLGFKILEYKDATHFRYAYDNEVTSREVRIAIVVSSNQYVPFDILNSFYCVDIGWDTLFPNLSKEALLNNKALDLDLLYSAYNELFENLSVYEKTSDYIVKKVYGKENIQNYLQQTKEDLTTLVFREKLNYNSWLSIAAKKGKAEYLAARAGISIDFSFVDEEFSKFIVNEYKSISSMIQKDSPIMVSRIMDYIGKSNEKTALIVLDGMSIFDFNILSAEFSGIEYIENYIYAMIPTTTAISRQSLLSGKFPVELEKPFNISKEEKEFTQKAKSLGYMENQILYSRGYNPDYGPNVKCLSIIINDIDDLVHGQTQGRIGMYNDIYFLAKSEKLQELIKRLFTEGFSVNLTSDHGNTLCKGIGTVKGAGVEVETKSKRMLILKDFAQGGGLMASYNLIEYPGYYLNKQYKYYICNTGTSLDPKDTMVMTHGGISIDEVIVPFIKIKAVQNV